MVRAVAFLLAERDAIPLDDRTSIAGMLGYFVSPSNTIVGSREHGLGENWHDAEGDALVMLYEFITVIVATRCP